MSMLTEKKDSPKGKKVLLYSGGMDSFMMAHLLKPDVLLYLDSHSKYDEAQLNAIFKQAETLQLPGKLVVKTPFDFSEIERDDLIVPSRNAYFLLMAANYGETIYFGKVFGDRSSDKSEEFFRNMEVLLNTVYQEQHWCEERKFEIKAPFSKTTKNQLISLYLLSGGKPEALINAYSCYSGQEKPCGLCKPCFRKWVALMLNGIDISAQMQNKPYLAPWLEELLPSIKEHKYRGEVEDSEILSALQLAGVI